MAGGRAQVPFHVCSWSEVFGLRAGALLIHFIYHSFIPHGRAPGTGLSTEDAALNKADGNPCFQKDYILVSHDSVVDSVIRSHTCALTHIYVPRVFKALLLFSH